MEDAYQSYVARRRASEAERPTVSTNAVADEPARRAVRRGWALYWAAWAAAAVAALVAFVSSADPGDGTGFTPGLALGLWAVAVLPALAIVSALGYVAVTVVFGRDPETGRVVWNDTSHGSTTNQLLAARVEREARR
jgi:hypothetical protein